MLNNVSITNLSSSLSSSKWPVCQRNQWARQWGMFLPSWTMCSSQRHASRLFSACLQGKLTTPFWIGHFLRTAKYVINYDKNRGKYLLLVNESESMDASQHCAHKVGLQQVSSLAVKPTNMCIKIVFVFISVILFVFIAVFVFVSSCQFLTISQSSSQTTEELGLLVKSGRNIPEPSHAKLWVVC